MLRCISQAIAVFVVMCCTAGGSWAQPGSTPTSAIDLLSDQINDLGQNVDQNTQQAELSLAQSQGAPDLLGEIEKLLEAIEAANKAQSDAETMEGILEQMALAGAIDVNANILTQAQADAIKAGAQDTVDDAKTEAEKAKRIAQQARDRLRGVYPAGLFGVRWTWPLFPFFLLLLLNTALVFMVYRRQGAG